MKEQKLDDLERMFSDGLKNLEAEPDAAVWTAIQDAMKKRRRFWLFWSVAGIVAMGLVATVLLQNWTMDDGPLTIVEEEVRDEETRSPEVEVMRRSGDEENTRVRHTEGERSKTDEPATTEDEEIRGSGNEENAIVRHPDRVRHSFFAKVQQANELSDLEETPRRVEGPEPLPAEALEKEGKTQNQEPSTPNPEPTPPITPTNVGNASPIPSLPIFLKQGLILPYTALNVLPYEPKNKPDTSIQYSPWSVAFNPAVILPSIQSYGKEGTVNYEKTNESMTGVSFGLNLNYTWKSNWILRAGFDWTSYTVSGNQRYFGYTDTVEWIDRERNTGFQVMENERTWAFKSQYNWIGIPLEIGRSQNFGRGFSWEWTLGAGINCLYRSGKLAENNPYLSGIDESLKPLQFNINVGFGVCYQIKGPWSTFVNVRYRYQPDNLYQSDLLREKHQVLRFGFGLQYQFIKRKGN